MAKIIFKIAKELIKPTINAGNDQSLSPSTVSSTLEASYTLGSGTLVSILWEEVSSKGAKILDPSSEKTGIADLQDGVTYEFKVTITNSDNLTASDNVLVTVAMANNSAPSCVEDVEFDIIENNVITLTPAEFNTAFSDPEGDAIQSIRITIVNTPAKITLKNGGTVINSGDIIPFSDIEAGNVTAEAGSTGETVDYEFEYEASDVGSGIFVGNCS